MVGGQRQSPVPAPLCPTEVPPASRLTPKAGRWTEFLLQQRHKASMCTAVTAGQRGALLLQPNSNRVEE